MRAEKMARRVIVVGLDGFEPAIVEKLQAAGRLPNLAQMGAAGGYSRLATTLPAQTPVAWSTFATGVNPGGHGIFDFIRRDPANYRVDLALNRYERRSALLPPRGVNLRRGVPLWQTLAQHGVPSVVLRCPCTYPPDDFSGRMLSGMGVPDLRGGFGTPTFFTTAADMQPGESEQVRPLVRDAAGRYAGSLPGPRASATSDLEFTFTVEVDAVAQRVLLHSAGQPAALAVPLGGWSDWLQVKFKAGLLVSVRGMVRWHLARLTPQPELYASPVNFAPESPLFAISTPPSYARDLSRQIGQFYTTGMVEDHTGLNNGRLDETAFLTQCTQVMAERERMLHLELDRQADGFVYVLFDTPDRIQHMFWRFGEPGHPVHAVHPAPGGIPAWSQIIDEHYQACDAMIGRLLERTTPDDLVIVLSDHGFGSFQRGVHLNAWLRENGWLAVRPGCDPDDPQEDYLRSIDWSRTRAYAVGIGSVYLNLAGREGEGQVPRDDAPATRRQLAAALAGLVDPLRGAVAITGASTRDEAYRGPYVDEAPDVVVRCARGYRASWETGRGAVPHELFADNTQRWSGDHIFDPATVPGVLWMSRPWARQSPGIVDMAPSIVQALGVPVPDAFEGKSLWQ